MQVFAADEEIDYRGWTIAFEELFTGHSDDMSELAARFLDEGMFKVLASTEAARLQSTAVRTGWVQEEWKKGEWKDRWLVLWRHPQAKDTNDFVLLKYVDPFGTPEGFLTLAAGKMHAMPPKSKRKDHSWCWRVDGTRSSVPGEFQDAAHMYVVLFEIGTVGDHCCVLSTLPPRCTTAYCTVYKDRR